MSRYIAAIDQGTTSTRCMLFDRRGPVVTAQREHAQHFPRPGWVEHDPMEIWQRTCEVIAEVVRLANVREGDIGAIGITNQRETTVAWDKQTGRPVCNAIVWQDTRTRQICDELAMAGAGYDRFRATTGLPLSTYFAGPKLRWILDHVPDARRLADQGKLLFGTIDTFLIWWLTGGPHGGMHLTDPTNASRTMLMNLETLAWDDAMIGALEIPPGLLPEIVPSSSARPAAMTNPDGPFGAAVPITGILGDQQAALVGQCCFMPGQAKNTYGTGCFMLMNTGPKIVHSRAGLVTTVGFTGFGVQGSGFGGQGSGFSERTSGLNPEPRTLNPVYALEGSIAVTGSLVQWLRDNLGLIEKSADVETLARGCEDNGGVYVVPAFSGLFAPYWRSDARGVICGLTRHSNKSHIARAALEATAYQSRDVLEAMHADSGIELSQLKVDGGMSVNSLLMQFQADVLGIPVTRSAVTETTAQGAAYAAGLAVGFWSSLDDLSQNWRADRTWSPGMGRAKREELCAGWRKAVEKSLGWVEG